ncbi:hypothetical protein PG991_015987 [Apiospora marii]|uniref:Carrier domain-containing protein n=1 Tax=Apiospora marii TaxID=335849 RepID=A0ABR1R082_9PEZI
MLSPQPLPLLRQLWAQVLGEQDDSIQDDDVFFDLGGDSLTAAELVDAAEEKGLLITIEDLFSNPSLKALASCAIVLSQRSSGSSSLETPPDSASDGLSSGDDSLSDTWLLTPRQKQLIDGGRPPQGLGTWRRAKLNVEAPLARIRQAFDALVKAQMACRARIDNHNSNENATYTAEKDVADAGDQYRFQYSLYSNLESDEVLVLEREAIAALDPKDGPVFSVVVYRTHGSLHLFLAASSIFVDESSWDIILDDVDRAISDKTAPASPSHRILALSESLAPTLDGLAGTDKDPAAGWNDLGSWGLPWESNCPNVSVLPALGAEESESLPRKHPHVSVEDAVLHVLQTFGARFGHFVADITLERSRPKGLERAVGNFQGASWAWVTGEAERSDKDHPRWGTLRQHIRRSLQDPGWIVRRHEGAKPPGWPASTDLAVHIRVREPWLRSETTYGVISDAEGPFDKPGDFATAPKGFVELDVSVSATSGPETVCIFDSRNRQGAAIETWAEELWKIDHYRERETGLSLSNPGDAITNGQTKTQAKLSSRISDRREVSADDRREIARQCGVGMDQIGVVYPCSPMQESLTVDVDGDANRYVMQMVFKVAGDVDLDHFRRAWEDTVRENAVLRTRICRRIGSTGYFQTVVTAESLRWECTGGMLDRFLERDAGAPMSVGDPFFRYTLVDEPGEEGENDIGVQRYFVWTVHHSLCDGASISMILDEVSRRFHGEEPRARPPFESFIQSVVTRTDPPQEQAFWQKALSELDPTPYPPVSPDPEFRAMPTSTLQRPLALGRLPAYGLTKALFLRAVWAILMSHYTGTEDVCFGTVNGGRTSAVPGIAHMMGPTINVTPVAVHVDPQEAVGTFFSRVRAEAAQMIPFEHSGVARIRRFLSGHHHHHATATDFRSLLVVHSEDFEAAIGPACRQLGIEYLESAGKKEQHPFPLVISLTLSPTTPDVRLDIQYDERVIATQQAHTLVHQFQTLLTTLSNAGADTLLGSISPLSDYDVAQIAKWNAFTPPVEETCVDWLFHQRVVEAPDSVAVCSTNQSLTYLEAERHSFSLAAQLVELGVEPGQFVGVCFEKSIWTVVAIMAVFQAGAVYVPIDPAHPRGRIKEVVDAVQLQVALASPAGAEVLQSLCPQLITVDGSPSASDPLAGEMTPSPISSRSTPASTAYLLFTSGSTGKPKGLLVSHAAICTSIKHHGAAFGAGPHWRTFQFCAHTFDMSVGEFLTTLAHGGCVCVPSEEARTSDLAGAITALRANTLLVVPTVANLLRPADVPTLRTLVLGGEPVTRETVTRWASSASASGGGGDGLELICSYGPSETAVWCAANCRVAPDAHPGNIGTSIGGTMWLAHPGDPERLTPVGCVGEIVISGAIVGQGYHADPAATDAAFVPAPAWLKRLDAAASRPYYARDDVGSKKIYRSGDLARYNPDGTLNIVGRLGTQVKLRGFRIELGEIENQIMTTGAVTAAVAALPGTGPCAGRIVAVVSSSRLGLASRCQLDISVVPKENRGVVVAKLESHLRFVLPHYMVPSVWVVVEKLPLLISGKVDRKAIQFWIGAMDDDTYSQIAPQQQDTSSDAAASRIAPGSLADTLRSLWCEMLNIPPDRVGPLTSFVAIGGDSLAAMRVASRAKGLGLPVEARSLVGNANTLADLVASVERSTGSPREDIQAATNKRLEIDWDAETSLGLSAPFPQWRQQAQAQEENDDDDDEREPDNSIIPSNSGLTVLLTGATGFFGRAVARALQHRPEVTTIHCLAVRDPQGAAARRLARACPKARLHAGDLTRARLGLDASTARRLFAAADAVVHNGAEVSFLKGYEALRDANVGSTREVVRLCLEFGHRRRPPAPPPPPPPRRPDVKTGGTRAWRSRDCIISRGPAWRL